ncbi:MAG: hypothetical protein ACFB22_12440 [Rhodothalassiaceae bacterium]
MSLPIVDAVKRGANRLSSRFRSKPTAESPGTTTKPREDHLDAPTPTPTSRHSETGDHHVQGPDAHGADVGEPVKR